MTPNDSARNHKMGKIRSLNCSICLMPIFWFGKVIEFGLAKAVLSRVLMLSGPSLSATSAMRRKQKKGAPLFKQYFSHLLEKGFRITLQRAVHLVLLGRTSWILQHGVGEVLILLRHCWRDAFFCVFCQN